MASRKGTFCSRTDRSSWSTLWFHYCAWFTIYYEMSDNWMVTNWFIDPLGGKRNYKIAYRFFPCSPPRLYFVSTTQFYQAWLFYSSQSASYRSGWPGPARINASFLAVPQERNQKSRCENTADNYRVLNFNDWKTSDPLHHVSLSKQLVSSQS